MPKNDSKKPVLFGADTTDSEQRHEADLYAWENFTPAWVPGFSETRKANEIAANPLLSTAQKEKLYAQIGAKPAPLPAEIAWVRVAAPDGGRSYNASIDLATWRARGYRPATVADLEAVGFQMPPTAHVEADGTIRREDTALWIVDGERARANRREQARYNAEFHSIKPRETNDPDVPFIGVEDQRSLTQATLRDIKES